jgi:lipopolysaccharide biosynthesis glycosyltransferase
MQPAAEPCRHVVFCADKGFVPHVGVAAYSLLANNRAHPLEITLIADAIADADRQRLERLGAEFGTRVRIALLRKEDSARLAQLGPSGHVTPAAYYRLLIPEALPETVASALYLDADVVVHGDIGGLLAARVGEYVLGACPDPVARELLGKPQYFNSGVLLMNLARWRAERIAARALELAARTRPRFMDQDALNELIAPASVLTLAQEYNLLVLDGLKPELERALDAASVGVTPKIIHFAGRNKPWHAGYAGAHREKYFAYLERSPWRETAPVAQAGASREAPQRPARALFAIPHYYDPRGNGFYGSLGTDPQRRVAAVAATILGLYQAFDRRQGLLDGSQRRVHPTNTANAVEVSVVVCTTQGKHLLAEVKGLQGLFVHKPTEADPPFLGFECHALLREALGRFDYYCFLEDDLLITDPQFFAKLAWFTALAGEEALLGPNRYEVAPGQAVHKLYIDGNMADPAISARFQDVADRPAVEGEVLGKTLRFQRINNPHSGAFFLNARQMERWAATPDFLARDPGFADPMASAATLGVMRHFRLYKPARENADFLELRHLSNRYLDARIRLGLAPS